MSWFSPVFFQDCSHRSSYRTSDFSAMQIFFWVSGAKTPTRNGNAGSMGLCSIRKRLRQYPHLFSSLKPPFCHLFCPFEVSPCTSTMHDCSRHQDCVLPSTRRRLHTFSSTFPFPFGLSLFLSQSRQKYPFLSAIEEYVVRPPCTPYHLSYSLSTNLLPFDNISQPL